MAKYIGTYATSGDVQTALDNRELSRPFIAYTTDNEDVIFGSAADKAEVGDIVVYSVADDLLHYIKQADYSASTYPVADYVPVGVVAYPQNDDPILGPSGEITFMGVNWLDKNKPDTGNTNAQAIEWGYNNFDIPELTNYANSGTAITDMNGKANTQIVLNYATAQTDWRTASAITFANEAGYYPLFECAWRYHTSGTAQGDWYVPAAGQISYIIFNNIVLEKMSTSLNILDKPLYWEPNSSYLSSNENNKGNIWYASYPNAYLRSFGKESARRCRPFCSKLMTRI